MGRKRKMETKHLTSLVLLTAAAHHPVIAGDLQIKPEVNATLYHYNSQFADKPSSTEQALVVIPSLLGTYDSQYFESSLSIKHTKVQQTSDEEGADKNYNDIKYSGRLTLIDEMLFLSATGSQNYQSIGRQETGIIDAVLRPGNLSKVRRNGANLTFSTPNPRYFGVELSGGYTTSDSDRSSDELAVGLNNKTINYQARLYQGEELQRLAWDFSFSNTNTSRNNFRDFESTSMSGYIGLGLYKNIRFILTANDESYDFDGTGAFNSAPGITDATSYGAGLEWYSSKNNNIAITYNQLDEGQANTTNYIGVKSNWALSNRTVLQFEYGKRFFGDTYNVDFNYNTKHFRSKLRYSEDISSFARLATNTENAGLFVCTIGVSDLSECFQPNTLQYELQAGEEFRQVELTSTDITEQVFLRKAGGWSLGYSLQKLTLSLDVNVSKTEYLESNRIQENRNARLSTVYQLGRRTDIGFDVSIARSDFGGETISDREDKTFSSNLSLSRILSNNLKVKIAGRYLKRNSNSAAAELSDRRATISLDYMF